MDDHDKMHEAFKIINRDTRRKESVKKAFALLRRIAIDVAIGVAVWFIIDALSKK